MSVGYSTDKKTRGSVMKKTPVIIRNINDLKKVEKNQIAIIGNIGKKKKIEIVKKAQELKIEIYRLNIEKFLKLNEKKDKKVEGKDNKPKEDKK